MLAKNCILLACSRRNPSRVSLLDEVLLLFEGSLRTTSQAQLVPFSWITRLDSW